MGVQETSSRAVWRQQRGAVQRRFEDVGGFVTPQRSYGRCTATWKVSCLTASRLARASSR